MRRKYAKVRKGVVALQAIYRCVKVCIMPFAFDQYSKRRDILVIFLDIEVGMSFCSVARMAPKQILRIVVWAPSGCFLQQWL